jgi:hypothetical protein
MTAVERVFGRRRLPSETRHCPKVSRPTHGPGVQRKIDKRHREIIETNQAPLRRLTAHDEVDELASYLEIRDLGHDNPLRFSTVGEQSVDPPSDGTVLTLPGWHRRLTRLASSSRVTRSPRGTEPGARPWLPARRRPARRNRDLLPSIHGATPPLYGYAPCVRRVSGDQPMFQLAIGLLTSAIPPAKIALPLRQGPASRELSFCGSSSSSISPFSFSSPPFVAGHRILPGEIVNTN